MPLSFLGAGVATLGAMGAAVIKFGADDPDRQSQSVRGGATTNNSVQTAKKHAGGVSPDNVPSYVLATSGLDNEQKLMVALCRRQAWLRAFQLGPTLSLLGYAAVVLVEESGLARLPRGSRLAVPLGGAVLGMTLGSYIGGREGKPMMNAALLARPVENAHMRRSERPAQEDALVSFIREGTQRNPAGSVR